MAISLRNEDFDPFLETLRQLEFRNVLEHIAKYCISQPGKEILLRTLPKDDIQWLRLQHDLIGEAVRMQMSDDTLPLENLHDSRHLLHKSMIQSALLIPTDLLEIADMMRVSRLIKSFIKPKFEVYPFIANHLSELFENKLTEKHIADAIDETGYVKDTASRELAKIRADINAKSTRLRTRLNKIVRQFSEDEMLQEEFFTIREGRFVIPIKVEHKRQLTGIIHGVSQSGSTVFVEPSEIIELNNELSMLKSDEIREVNRILQGLTEEIGEDAQALLTNIVILSELDVIIAKAKYALDYGGIKPEILEAEDNFIYLKSIKHPVLAQARGVKNVIPLSLEFDDNKRGHLISGPNAGGKTVALKNIGLNIAMALSGIFPLGECKTNYRTIFSTIGDHQSIENDLSTFSSQMLQIKSILDNATANSLVLIDEIGSGTDPQEGAALASGILDTFIELNLFFVATTHQSSLKTYALNKEVIANASLEFDEQKFKPTYTFLTGIPGNSYAFSLAENIGMSKLVLKRAKSYLGDKHSILEDSISILQKYRSEAVASKSAAESMRFKYEKLLKDYEARSSELRIKKKEIIDKARIEAMSIVDNANSLVEKTIREIKEEKRALTEIKADFKSEKETLEKAVKKIEKSVETKIDSPESLSEGESVGLNDSTSVGTVLEADNSTKLALVDFNGVRFKMPYKQLIRKKASDVKKSVPLEYIKYDAVAKLDYRGMRADEALRDLDEAIDNSLLNNVDFITIVHGKGTGALRQAIHEFLSRHPSVASYRLGEIVEGGAGVTIVKFHE